jgi:peptide/nickel transport system substrate-binding protein
MALISACSTLAPSAIGGQATPPAAGGPATAQVGSPTSLPAANGGPTTAAAAKPSTSGGTLRVGVLGDLSGLDGHLTTGLDSSRRIWDPVSLLDDKLNTVPVLAQSVELSPDAMQMTLRLRPGVQFHTGREMTADDVIWNYTRLKDPKVNPIYANLVKPFASIDAPDKYTVHVQFDAPDPFVGDALPNLVILDPVTFQQDGPNQPVGTGPFTFVEWVQGDHLTLKRNPNYWDTGKPYVDQLSVQVFKDPQAMITEFEAGALDLALQPTLVDWVRIKQAGTAQALINTNSGNYVGMAFNCGQSPTDNKLLRQALQFSMDRQRFANTVWQGVEHPLTLLWFPTCPAYDAAKNQTYAFDLDKARALLDQAAVGDVALDFNYQSTMPDFGLMGQIWQADLEKIGVKLTMKPTEPVSLMSSMQRQQYNGIASSTGFYGQLHGGVVWTSPYFGPVNNYASYKDDRYTQLTLAVYSEADPSRRKAEYDAWNDFILDQSPVTAVATQFPRAVAAPNVQGLVYSIGGNYLDVTGAGLGSH